MKQEFSDFKVEQHASPIWLQPQHLDSFLPERRVAIEYHGEQQYRVIAIAPRPEIRVRVALTG